MPGMRPNFFLPRFRKTQKRGAPSGSSQESNSSPADSPPVKRNGSAAAVSQSSASTSLSSASASSSAHADSASSHSFAATFAAIADRAGAEKLLPASHGMGRTIQFFQRGTRDGGGACEGGGYFTAHGAAAVALASLFGEQLHRNSSSGLESINLNHKLMRRVLRSLLLRKRCKVEIWANASSSSSSLSASASSSAAVVVDNWMLSKRASPASFHDVKHLLFQSSSGGGGGDDDSSGGGGGLDQSVFAAEAASCMSLAVNNRRLDCGCSCAEVRVAVANEAREFVGVYAARIHWNVTEARRCSACQSHCSPAARRAVRACRPCTLCCDAGTVLVLLLLLLLLLRLLLLLHLLLRRRLLLRLLRLLLRLLRLLLRLLRLLLRCCCRGFCSR